MSDQQLDPNCGDHDLEAERDALRAELAAVRDLCDRQDGIGAYMVMVEDIRAVLAAADLPRRAR